MSLRRPAALPPSPSALRIQREHELNAALEAARSLQARLEMLGDRDADARWVRQLRDDMAQEVHGLLDGLPCQPLTAESRSSDDGPSSSREIVEISHGD